jgi:hypothetical protein
MPRKPKVQSRNQSPRAPPTSKKRIHQCINCGALVDPIYGLGNGSWCPHCHKTDDICYDEGKIPDPILYGAWLQMQEKAEAEKTKTISNPPNAPPRTGDLNMHTAKYHNGTFHCPEC